MDKPNVKRQRLNHRIKYIIQATTLLIFIPAIVFISLFSGSNTSGATLQLMYAFGPLIAIVVLILSVLESIIESDIGSDLLGIIIRIVALLMMWIVFFYALFLSLNSAVTTLSNEAGFILAIGVAITFWSMQVIGKSTIYTLKLLRRSNQIIAVLD